MSETTYSLGLIALDAVVDEFLLLSNRPESDYRKYLQTAIRGYLDLRLNSVREGAKSIKVSVSDIDRVDFPSDLVDFISIGEAVDGKFWGYTQRDDGVITTTEEEGVEIQDSDNEEGEDLGEVNVNAYYSTGGVNVKGYYTVEWDKRRIKIYNSEASTLTLNYITSGMSLDGQTYIPVTYVMAIQAFMEYWGKELDPNISPSQKQISERTYLRLRRELTDRQYSLEEWETAIYKTMYPLARR